MRTRVNAVVSKFTEKFGVSPDIVSYDKGLVVAFKIYNKNGRIISMIAKETKEGKIICKKEVEKIRN